VHNEYGRSPFLIVADHAGNFVPRRQAKPFAMPGTKRPQWPFPNACRVKGFSNVESNAGVERLVRVIAADCAAGLGSAKRHCTSLDAHGGARLRKTDRSAPYGDRESSGARRSAIRRGRRRHQRRQEPPCREEGFGRLQEACPVQQATADEKVVNLASIATTLFLQSLTMPRRKKLLRAFGDKVFEVIETQADRLREVGGIGPVRAAPIDEPIRSIPRDPI
jgi:hypothetical protein